MAAHAVFASLMSRHFLQHDLCFPCSQIADPADSDEANALALIAHMGPRADLRARPIINQHEAPTHMSHHNSRFSFLPCAANRLRFAVSSNPRCTGAPPQSLHVARCRPCSHTAEPPHSCRPNHPCRGPPWPVAYTRLCACTPACTPVRNSLSARAV